MWIDNQWAVDFHILLTSKKCKSKTTLWTALLATHTKVQTRAIGNLNSHEFLVVVYNRGFAVVYWGLVESSGTIPWPWWGKVSFLVDLSSTGVINKFSQGNPRESVGWIFRSSKSNMAAGGHLENDIFQNLAHIDMWFMTHGYFGPNFYLWC